MKARAVLDTVIAFVAALTLVAGLAAGNARLAATDRADQEAFASVRGIGR